MSNRIVKVYSHPRVGAEFLMATLAENFYEGVDLSIPPGEFGHWSNRQIQEPYNDRSGEKTKVNKCGKLAGSHIGLTGPIEDGIYMTRDCRATLLSVWKCVPFRRVEDADMAFEEFLWTPLDWIDSPAIQTRPNQQMMPIVHWLNHIMKWLDSSIYVVRYEDLVLNPIATLEKIEKVFSLERTTEELHKVDNLVGWRPRTGTIDAWKKHWSEDMLKIHDYIVPLDFPSRFD